ncbi:MAG TPA: hypothetical protein VMA36_10305 [Candidatus Limnocylindria bacterium]|nr:hypothetical protein [Candidatus Limnocylindria bacterium]
MSPTPSPVPAPSASASASPAPISVGRSRIGIVPGATLRIPVTGGIGRLRAAASFDGLDAQYDPVEHTLILTATTPGSGTVMLNDASGNATTVPVLVAPAAGVVPRDATVELAGTDGAAFVASRVHAAIAAAAQLQPGAAIVLRGLTIPDPLKPGIVLEGRAQVEIDGNGRFVDQLGTTDVHVVVDTLPTLAPQVLFYSDDPETLGATDEGVLFHGTIDAAHPARAYVYHVSKTPGRHLYLALQAPSGARVQILGIAAGPSGAWAYVGHVSTDRYLLERSTQESFVADVPAQTPYLFPLAAFTQPNELIDAIYDLRVLDGGPVQAVVVAANDQTETDTLLAQPELAGDGHGRRGEFALTGIPPLALAYVAGGPEPPPFTVGFPVFPNLRPGGRALGGDYGVLRQVALQLSNPAPTPQNVYLYEMLGNTGGGGTTTTIWFDGDAAPTEVPCVRLRDQRYLVKAFPLAPGETRTVTGEYMTDGTSSFPLSFGLTSTPPPAPGTNACSAHPTLPSPAPEATTIPSAAP